MGRGAAVTGAAQAVKLGCQIASVIVLSRLLRPEDFGIIAMAAPVLGFAAMFQDLGLTQATVQKKTVTHAEINSLFWINIAVSLLLATVLIVISPMVAEFYGEPRVEPLVAALSLQLFIQGATAQHQALLNRRMAFGRLAILDSLAALLGLGVAIIWAYVTGSYWALFFGGLTTIIVAAVGTWISSHWRPGLPRWVSGTRDMVGFGAGLTGFNFANYFARNLDSILIGRRWGNQELGLYDRAYRLLLFPLQQITNPLAKVMVPALSRMNDEPDRYRRAYLRVVPLLLLAALPGIAVAIATAELLVPLALGEQWRGSARIFQALGFAGLLQLLNNPSGWLFISQGRSLDFMNWGIFGALTAAAAFVIGLPYGAFGVALAYAISEYLRTPLLWLFVGRKGPVQARHILRTAMPFMLGAHIAVAVLWLLRPHLPAAPVPALIAAAMLAYLIVAGVAALFPAGREALAEARALVQKLLPARVRSRRA
ncbi:lipopolysaccharide biosynthesis protein [uncultured Paracoccus sp.]|uniref:lipopolysaccharide biosynthesis protein n=1 Tax=uncultured Paracoccus sp. TaxID=189685 RepID=UPI00260612BA|nr:lipopolysaccharide biosynthesis protein [uncultured Paracoccus sp.]